MTSSNFHDHKKENKKKLQFSKSGIPLHMLSDIQYMEYAMEHPEDVIDLKENDGTT
tara:strand:+ start:211 stop:378 length:168 start_codon:yes stop_codon:yes gene_type:complete